MIIARQSTARTITVGPVLDADGVAVTGSVVGDFKIAKNGGAPAALNGSATLTHRHTGNYSLALTASDLDTVGQAEVTCDDTVNACPIKEVTVIEEAVYDISFAASATGAVPVASIASGAITATSIAADAFTAAKFASDVTTELQNGLATAAELAKVPKSDGTATWNATALAAIQSEANDALVAYDPPTNAELVSEINAVQSDIAALNNLSAAQVNAEVDAAIETYHLDHLLAVTYDPASKPGAADALLNELVESDGGVARYTANALEQAPSGTGASASAIADEVQTRTIAAVTLVNGLAANVITAAATAADFTTEIQSGLATAAALATVDDFLDTEIAALTTELAKVPKSDGTATWNATALASLQAEATDALNAYDPPTRAELTTDTNSVLTAVGDVPTNAELATALGTADDAVLAQVALVKAQTDKFTNLPVLTAGGTGGQGYGAP